jgi:RecB family exonuclease
VGFLQCLLDASLIALLQHTPAHRMLKRLSNRLVPALEDAAALAQLHAPLAPYARAQTRALREGNSTTKPAPAAKQGDWRQRRKAKHEQAALAIGVYQLEELII